MDASFGIAVGKEAKVGMDAGDSRGGISLSGLLPQRHFFKADDIRVSSCCTNPSMCQKGDLFVATVGSDQDGHEDVVEAAQRGIAGVVCERILPVEIPQCIVPNARAALAAICQGLAGFPSKQLPVVGVAGSASLTPCALLFERVLEKSSYFPAGFNHLSYSSGLCNVPRTDRSTSTAQHAKWLATALANGCSHAVTELPRHDVANHTFDATRLSGLMLTSFQSASGRTSVSASQRAYFDRVLQCLDTDGILVANVDCPVIAELLRFVERPVLTVSAGDATADLSATVLERCPHEQTFMLRAGYDTVAVRSRILGGAHVNACLLVTAAALGQGMDLTTIVSALESVARIPGHLERVECGQPFSVFTDGATTSAELEQSLAAVRKVTQGKLVCLFGPGGLRHTHLRWRRGRIVERWADLPIITSDDPGDPQPLQTAHDILDGMQRPAVAHVLPNRIRAIEWALTQCDPGDALVLVGPHNRKLTARDDHFPTDYDTARYWLYESASHVDLDWLLPR